MKWINLRWKNGKWQRFNLLVCIGILTIACISCGGGGSGSSGDPLNYAIDYNFLMYRNYENGTSSGYIGIIGISDNGGPIAETDVIDVQMQDSGGGDVSPATDGFYHNTYMWYDCLTGTCSQSGPREDTGIWGQFTNLPTDIYDLQVEMENGQALDSSGDYPGQIILPYVSSSSMQTRWVGTDLELAWTNPTGEANWGEVDQLRIVLLDNNSNIVVYVVVAPTDETVTIPEALLDQAEGLQGGNAINNWQIQTRAYDANSMNFARGYSNTLAIPALNYGINYTHLMYRNYENASANNYIGIVGISDSGAPIDETDVVEVALLNSAGGEVGYTSEGFYHNIQMWYDCRTGTCSPDGPREDSGVYAGYADLPVDIYDVEIEMENGQILTASGDYPGQLVLPYVPSSSMQAQWIGTDLQLSWTNPTGESNWSEVTQLRIAVFDNDGNRVINVFVAPADETVTLPKTLLDQAQGLMGGTSLERWQIQTRVYDSNSMNIARGYSNTVDLPDGNYAISHTFLMYNNFESIHTNTFMGIVGVKDSGGPIENTDIVEVVLKNSAGGDVSYLSEDFYHLTFMWYDCSTGTCSQDGPREESGVYARYADLPADTYDVEVEMENGQILTDSGDYPGQLVLPYVPSGSRRAVWNGTDLELSWTNPTGDPNWSEVDQLRVELYDNNGDRVLFVRLAPTDQAVTLPEALLTQALGLGGTSLDEWRIHTRAYDSNNMNIARGFSNTMTLPVPDYAIKYAYLMYRNYETASNNKFMGLVGISDGGAPIEVTDVLDVAVQNSGGGDVGLAAEGFYHYTFMFYNCISGSCTESGPQDDTGVWARFADLPADTYSLQIDMENGQTLSDSRAYPGQLILPYVASSSMQAQWSGADLALSWTNPTSGWSDVDQVRVALFDNLDNLVLFAIMAPSDEAVTIPAALISQVQGLHGGTSLGRWLIQTRAYSGSMNIARGQSNSVDLP